MNDLLSIYKAQLLTVRASARKTEYSDMIKVVLDSLLDTRIASIKLMLCRCLSRYMTASDLALYLPHTFRDIIIKPLQVDIVVANAMQLYDRVGGTKGWYTSPKPLLSDAFKNNNISIEIS